jgi:hypothetical protein
MLYSVWKWTVYQFGRTETIVPTTYRRTNQYIIKEKLLWENKSLTKQKQNLSFKEHYIAMTLWKDSQLSSKTNLIHLLSLGVPFGISAACRGWTLTPTVGA